MRKIEVTAKTVEQAIEKGLQMLGTTKEMVEIRTLEKESMLKRAKIEVILFNNIAEKEEYLKENQPVKQTEKPVNHNFNNSNNKHKKNNVVININKSSTNEQLKRTTLTDKEKVIESDMTRFLKEYFSYYKKDAVFTTYGLDSDLYIEVNGEGMGSLIGHHGETLEALQNIVNAIVRNNHEDYKNKVFVDIERYREKRKEILEGLAKRMASKVVSMKKSLKLEAMNSFERRIIHFALQGVNNINTFSEGSEPNRYLVIEYVD